MIANLTGYFFDICSQNMAMIDFLKWLSMIEFSNINLHNLFYSRQ